MYGSSPCACPTADSGDMAMLSPLGRIFPDWNHQPTSYTTTCWEEVYIDYQLITGFTIVNDFWSCNFELDNSNVTGTFEQGCQSPSTSKVKLKKKWRRSSVGSVFWQICIWQLGTKTEEMNIRVSFSDVAEMLRNTFSLGLNMRRNERNWMDKFEAQIPSIVIKYMLTLQSFML